jgi:hypothetical protein
MVKQEAKEPKVRKELWVQQEHKELKVVQEIQELKGLLVV